MIAEGQADAAHHELLKIKESRATELTKLQEECGRELRKVKELHAAEFAELHEKHAKASKELEDMRASMDVGTELVQQEGHGKDDGNGADIERQCGHDDDVGEAASEHGRASMGMTDMTYLPEGTSAE